MLTATLATKVLFVCVVVAALAVAHVYLRFAISDTQLEHRRLQAHSQQLRKEVLRLEREKTRFDDMARLRDFAMDELRMVDAPRAGELVATVPDTVRLRYLGHFEVHPAAPVEPDALAPRGGGLAIERVALAITDLNRAFAAMVGGASETDPGD